MISTMFWIAELDSNAERTRDVRLSLFTEFIAVATLQDLNNKQITD